jgi:beta-glucanase (GH16 family)
VVKEMTSPWSQGYTVFMKKGGETEKCSPPKSTTYSPSKEYATELVWADEFKGDSLDESKWDVIENGMRFNDELQMYKKEGNVAVSDGVLHIKAKCEKSGDFNFTSAKLHSRQMFGAGNRVEARIKMSKGKGTWPAFWLMGNGTDEWPRIGEIDVLEYTSCAGEIMGNMHYQNRNGEGALNTYKLPGNNVQSWHEYRIDWTEDGISFYLDGKSVGSAGAHDTYAAWPYNTNNYFIILNLAMGGTLGGFCLKEGQQPECNQVLDVDWVRVSKLT